MWRICRTLTINKFKYSSVRTHVCSNVFTVMKGKQYHQSKSAKRRKEESTLGKDGSNEDVLYYDVKRLMDAQDVFKKAQGEINDEVIPGEKHLQTLPERWSEIEVNISELSSTGDGLGLVPELDHVYVVPFTVPGDVVKAKVVHHFPQRQYTLTDFVEVVKSSPQRDDNLIGCPYFAKCAGCQFQMLPYNLQLEHKKTIVQKAFQNFSSLTPDVIPQVDNTIASPLQYGYRTKLTPHFDGPPGCMSRKAKRDPSERKGFSEVPPIGFMQKGTRKTIDIEDCPIGTDAVREGIRIERKRIADEISTYKKGATVLLRETTLRKPKQSPDRGNTEGSSSANGTHEPELPIQTGDAGTLGAENMLAQGVQNGAHTYFEEKSYITDQNATSTEYIDDYIFKNTAGAFFQNNNSILPKVTSYVREHIVPSNEEESKPIKYLIDAYCGSGLFTITLSSIFSSSMGIDVAGASIVSARENALANHVKNATFMTADASKLFEEVTFPADKTAVIIDPPRKGCDDAFLQQLLKFGPQRIIYVSCNVHTQARDVGVLVEGAGECKYDIKSLQGFDFFPQTSHVEGIAVLTRSVETSA